MVTVIILRPLGLAEISDCQSSSIYIKPDKTYHNVTLSYYSANDHPWTHTFYGVCEGIPIRRIEQFDDAHIETVWDFVDGKCLTLPYICDYVLSEETILVDDRNSRSHHIAVRYFR